MSFAFKGELNELVIFRRCCSAANLCVLILSHLSTIEGAFISHEPHSSNIGGSSTLDPMNSAPSLQSCLCCVECSVSSTETPVYIMRPLYGPLAGGTRLTIIGQNVNISTVTAVYFGRHKTHPDGDRFSSPLMSMN